MTTRTADPILLEVVRNRLTAIADEMELSLLRAAYSPIVKEGLDASAALFDRAGRDDRPGGRDPDPSRLPGSGGREQILVSFPPESDAPGDVYVLNDPYEGGTHLPDIVAGRAGRRRWAAGRADDDDVPPPGHGRHSRRAACRPTRPTSSRRVSASRR